MAGPLVIPRAKRQSVLAQIETDYGVDEFGVTPPAVGQMKAVFDVSVTEQANIVENPVMSGRLGNVLPDTIGAISTEVTFKQRLRGNVAGQLFDASNLPESDELLRACGMSRTIGGGVGTETATYEPEDSTFESLSLLITGENSPAVKVIGCVGTVNFVCIAGDAIVAEYRFLGAKVDDAAQALIDSSFSKTPQYPVLKSAGFTLDSVNTFRVQNFNVDLNNSLDAVESMNAASAVEGYYIGSRNLNGSFDPEKVVVATYDFDSKWRNANMLSWDVNAGSVQYNQAQLIGTNLQIIQKGHGTRGDKQNFDLSFKLFLDTSVAGMQLIWT